LVNRRESATLATTCAAPMRSWSDPASQRRRDRTCEPGQFEMKLVGSNTNRGQERSRERGRERCECSAKSSLPGFPQQLKLGECAKRESHTCLTMRTGRILTHLDTAHRRSPPRHHERGCATQTSANQ
jgi:hypothetical protein